MARNSTLIQCANYLIILSVCIDQGDGRWKERDKENLRRDLMAYERMAEKLEHEIEAFYEEYPDEWLSGGNIDRIHYKYLTNLLNRNTETTKESENKEKEKYKFSPGTDGVTVHKESFEEKSNKPNVLSQHFTINESNIQQGHSEWPKFEDILLAIGRKYDWKNDRWIKVRMKSKTKSNEIETDKVDFHENHRFSYRLVKLKGKTRRNIVVAVSAVR